jgi:type IV pilus assembly protein PilM
MFGSKIWGLDLGRSAVKGVLVTPGRRNGVKILDADIVPLEGPPPEQGANLVRDPRLWQALRVFNERHGIHGQPVALAVPAQNVLVRDLEVPSVGQKKMQELVRFEASSEIPFVLDEVMWDYTLFPQTEQNATRRGFLLAIKKNVIERYLRGLDELGIEKIETITVSPLALLHFVRMEFADTGRTMALDVGAQSTSMLVVDESRFWMRTINSGGQRVTEIMQDEFELDFDAAEKAKRNMKSSQFAASIIKAIRPAMDELVRDVRTNVNYLEKSEGLGPIDSAYRLGGGARLPGLARLASRTLDMRIKPISELRHVAVSGYAEVDYVRTNIDRLATAIGAGMTGLQADAEDVSFLPTNVERAARISKSRGAVLLSGLLIWIILLSGWGASRLTERQISAGADRYREVASLVNSTSAELESVNHKIDLYEREMDHLLRVGRGAGQFLAVQDRVVKAFESASAREGPFQILSYSCQAVEVERPSTHPGLIEGTLRGHVDAAEGNQRAYNAWRENILNGLRAGLSPPIATAGQAQVSPGSEVVTGKRVRWAGLVKEGDYFMALLETGERAAPRWYRVRDVRGTRLVLTEPHAGQETAGDYVIARVDGTWKPSDFPISFALLREPATSVDEIKKP